MSVVFSAYHKGAIAVHEFINAGWSAHDYLTYRNLCSKIRAGIIAAEMSEVDATSIVGSAISELSNLIQDTEPSIPLELDWGFISTLATHIRYMEDNYDTVGVIPEFYRSEEDFRALVEHSIYTLLNQSPDISEDGFLFCNTKQNVISFQQAYLEERENVLENIELELPDAVDDRELYNWARKKSDNIHRILKIDEILDDLQHRIDELSGDSTFDAAKSCLYVYKGFIKCIRENHNSICVNAIIPCADGRTATLNVMFCTECKRFYISYEEYVHYLHVYGTLLTKIMLINDGAYISYDNNLAEASPLKLCGYSVSVEKGLTKEARQTILRTVIHNSIMKKPDVIRYLNWFIIMQGSKFGNERARLKWEEDLGYVRNLDCNTQSNYVIRDISIHGKFGQFVRDK